MKGLLVHGCYDKHTFRTLEALDVEYVGFDLRARSPALVTYKTLLEILPEMKDKRPVLVFQDDSREMIMSYLDLLKGRHGDLLLEFRDKKNREFYENLKRPFVWYFSPDADWQGIISSANCEGVILPLKYQSLYHDLPHLWTLIEENEHRIWLHAESAEEARLFDGNENIQASFDLTTVFQSGARMIDQEHLKSMKCWRKINESAPGQ